MNYRTVIGLEVHLQLKTRTKAFCGCPTGFGKEPNSQTCPVCLGFPGSLPVLNAAALDHAIKVGLALGCRIAGHTKFDRKNYFYPDLPKNYQISQYDLPVARDGALDIITAGQARRIRIRRVHLEEDAGKLIHEEGRSLVDFNRAGLPLLEVVSEPDIVSAQEAHDYLTALKSILEYLEVSDCDMEKGSLRCDANISLCEAGASELGVKSELKNMNSFKAVKDALAFEAGRQAGALERGERVVQETRLWDAREGKTVSMRSKEEAMDYRYFPEPDLPGFIISEEKKDQIRISIPELPREKAARFVREYRLSEYDAGILVADKNNAAFSEECLKLFPGNDKKAMVNWIIGPLFSEANSRGLGLCELGVSAAALAELAGIAARQELSNLAAKTVLAEMVASKKSPAEVIKEKNLAQVSDAGALDIIADEVLKANPQSVESYKSGKDGALMFLVGQAMKKSGGKANPRMLQEILKRRMV